MVQFVQRTSGILAIQPQIEALCSQVNSLLSTGNQVDNDTLKNALIAAEPFYNQLVAFDNISKKDDVKTADLCNAIESAKKKYTSCLQSYERLCEVQAELAKCQQKNVATPDDEVKPLENLLGSAKLKLTF